MPARRLRARRRTSTVACPTPGRKIRSRGLGRGLAIGGGRGPIGVPYGEKVRRRRR